MFVKSDDNTLTTKNVRTSWTIWTVQYYIDKMGQKSLEKRDNTPDEKREGGRTVGSGRVATVIE